MNNLDLPLVFTILMGIAIWLYVVFDGYDLGIGMLMPAADAGEQELMVASIGPFWDANETWLVLGVGILLAAFPRAHGVVLGALYLPVAAMLIGLMLRGVAFEFRIKALGWHRELWNWIFWFGSFLAAFAQGWMLGRYITGFESGIGYALFSLLVGASLCGAYVLIGAAWLILKTEGKLQRKAHAWARWGLLWIGLGLVLISIASPLISQTVFAKWFDFPRTLVLMVLPAGSVVAGWVIWRATRDAASIGAAVGAEDDGAGNAPAGRGMSGAEPVRSTGSADWVPLAGATAIFSIAFLGLAYSIFPYIVIDRMTIWDAASHRSALVVVLVGFLAVLPFLAWYTIYAHRVFWGKVKGPLYGR